MSNLLAGHRGWVVLERAMSFPFCNQADLFDVGPRPVREKRRWDDDGYERTELRNGAAQCPKCGLWWPNIEEPDMWTESDAPGRRNAVGWWGGVVCSFCDILIIEQPDGRAEAYDLSSSGRDGSG